MVRRFFWGLPGLRYCEPGAAAKPLTFRRAKLAGDSRGGAPWRPDDLFAPLGLDKKLRCARLTPSVYPIAAGLLGLALRTFVVWDHGRPRSPSAANRQRSAKAIRPRHCRSPRRPRALATAVGSPPKGSWTTYDPDHEGGGARVERPAHGIDGRGQARARRSSCPGPAGQKDHLSPRRTGLANHRATLARPNRQRPSRCPVRNIAIRGGPKKKPAAPWPPVSAQKGKRPSVRQGCRLRVRGNAGLDLGPRMSPAHAERLVVLAARVE